MSNASPNKNETTMSGIEAMRGVGAARAKGFWADAWDRVIVRFGARLSLAWIGTIAFFAIFAPIIANAHPMFRTNTATGAVDSPLWTNLTSVDLVLLAGGLFALPWYYMPASWGARFGLRERGKRLGFLLLLAMQGGATVVLAGVECIPLDCVDGRWRVGRSDCKFHWRAVPRAVAPRRSRVRDCGQCVEHSLE